MRANPIQFEAIEAMATAARIGELAVGSAKGFILFVVPFVVVLYVIERWAGGDAGRYRTRAFIHDLLYGLFYRGGFYGMLVFSAVTNILEAPLDAISARPLANAPFWLTAVLFWVGGDFVLYWIHRLQHRVQWLWAFHSIHHSQEHLTTVTQYRRHPVDFLMNDFSLFVIFVVVLGVPGGTWMPLYIGMATLQAMQHAELDWSYGVFYRLVVSPLFHAYHHSADPAHHHRNFGQMFSTWDHVFGTAARRGARPQRFGIDGYPTEKTILGQLVAPFLMIGRSAGRQVLGRTAHRKDGWGRGDA